MRRHKPGVRQSVALCDDLLALFQADLLTLTARSNKDLWWAIMAPTLPRSASVLVISISPSSPTPLIGQLNYLHQ